VVTHGIAILVGAGLGAGALRLSEYYENPEAMSRPEGDLSRAELIGKLDEAAKQYSDLATQSKQQAETAEGELTVATQKVTDLETKIGSAESEIKVLELKVKKGQGKSAALEKQLKQKQEELSSLKGQLDVALQEKARLEADLVVSREETRVARDETVVSREETRVAREETVTSREETRVAREEAVNARWEGFVAETIVQICEKGNKNKLGRCKEEVRDVMAGARAQRFKHCVSSGQASPRLVRVDARDKEPTLPKWSEWVNQSSKFTQDTWYITFCDPSLPESRGLRAGEEDEERPADRFEGLDEEL
jgi:hypothetical protein